MRIEQTSWRGEAPRLTPRALPQNAAQDATNARLQSGDLQTWRQYAAEHTLVMTPPVETIYRLNGAWLSWAGDVAVARGPVPGDTTFRTILAGPTVYSQPQLTTFAMATSGPEPYPVATRPLGVPGPSNRLEAEFFFNTGLDEPSAVTSYVYTYVNDLGQESAPSPPTPTINSPTGGIGVNLLTFPAIDTSIPDAYGIVAVRVYRAATGATGTAFLFVTQVGITGGIPNSVADTLDDSELAEALPSSLWDLPPTNLQGILALPNGVVAGFFDNVLCFSAQNFPHAWPVSYQLTTDTNIVGIGNIDTTVILFTESFTYLAIGTDPAAYSMTKLETAHAGVSRRSITSVLEVGVVGATPDGLLAVLGNGQVQNVTDALFTRRQWQALNPSSILGVEHDNVYFFFYDTGESGGKGGYALDASTNGFGLVPLNVHASAAYSDPIEDQLYLVLDATVPIVDALMPVADTLPTGDGITIYEFDSPDSTSAGTYRYHGKLNLMPRPVAFGFCQVKAEDYTNLVLRLFGNGALFYERVITDKLEFTLPLVDEYDVFEFELVGTSVVRTIRFGESVDELDESNP